MEEKMKNVVIEGLFGETYNSKVVYLGKNQGLEIFVEPDKHDTFAIAYKIKEDSIKYSKNKDPILSFMHLHLDQDFIQKKGDRFYRHIKNLQGEEKQ